MYDIAEEADGTQKRLLREVLRHKEGLSVEVMAERLKISRNAVRQHLAVLERDGLIARRGTRPSGGRPEHLYILTAKGMEHFPRQYTWFAGMLLKLVEQMGKGGLDDTLAELGRGVGASMKPQLPGDPGSPAQIAEIAKAMTEIGYDAAVQTEGGESFIAAHNCVFHRLASDHPEVCGFDVAMLSASSGCEVEHRSCMIRGGSACRFHFQAGKKI